MRRRSVVATAALIAALALTALPVPGASPADGGLPLMDPVAFEASEVPAIQSRSVTATGRLDASDRSDGHLEPGSVLVEPGATFVAPAGRPRINQPAVTPVEGWKPPKYTLTGYASFYDNGTTAMRLPRGTIVRICGAAGCIQRTINDYGPQESTGRIIDLYRADFFAICGCAWHAGTTEVTIGVY